MSRSYRKVRCAQAPRDGRLTIHTGGRELQARHQVRLATLHVKPSSADCFAHQVISDADLLQLSKCLCLTVRVLSVRGRLLFVT